MEIEIRANMLYVIELIKMELKKKNIFVRYFKKPRIDNYLRITIGTEQEMQQLYDAVREIVDMQSD